MTATVMKIKVKKVKPRIEHYCDYKTKTFSNAKFCEYWLSKFQEKILVLLSRVSPTRSLGEVGRHCNQNHQKLLENWAK